jgi:hypothetical protein
MCCRVDLAVGPGEETQLVHVLQPTSRSFTLAQLAQASATARYRPRFHEQQQMLLAQF